MRAYRIGLMVLVGLLGPALFAGCNTSSTSNGSGNTTASPTGVWGGTDAVTGDSVVGYIDAAGQATFIRGDGTQFVGSVQVSGSTLVATVDGFTKFPTTFSDNSTYGIGTLNGSVSTGASLTASLSFTTNGGTAVTGTWSLTFNSLTNTGSSLSTLAANYTDNVSGTVISISSDGVMSGQNAANACVLNGTVTISNSAYDIYEVAYSYANCTGADAVLNGVQFTGLAVLNSSVSPAQLTVATTGTATSGDKYGLVATLNAS